ncbi:MAG: NUDIX hydrolase [PVC group bacterium]
MNSQYKTKQSREIYRGPFFSLREYLVEYPDGEEKKRIILEHPGAGAAVPLLDDDRVVMVRQFRKAAGRVTLEIPAGKMENGENPEDCIRRELREEIGYRAGRLTHLRSYYPSFGISSEIIHVYLAEDLLPAPPAGGDEIGLGPVILPLAEVRALIGAGKIMDSKTIIGVRELDRFRTAKTQRT